MDRIEIEVGAKINIGLSVGEREANGYHSLRSIFYAVDLLDRIELQIAGGNSIEIEGFTECPAKDSTIFKAARLFLEKHRISTGLRIRVRKQIPSQAGLGGGSADAAAILAGLNHLFGIAPETTSLICLGAEIGSDVPFFLSDSPAFITGRGERVEPIHAREPFSALIVKPPFGVSTREAFAGLVLHRAIKAKFAGYSPTSASWGLADARSAEEALSLPIGQWAFYNDFSDYLFETFPIYKNLEKALKDSGAAYVSISGSGSCIYGIFVGPDQALDALRDFSAKTISGMALYAIKPLERTLCLG
ncbi:MAG: 4-diphosphocytidyl-2-C-methyl-D-erythritol kinase [Spirochaetes bacterium]|nr:MAG: 4-diphosphocytidyl-2-C-methyl-D-erythritol kinase [Spirochaetota bacterium]